MMPFNRSSAPQILKDNYKRFGKRWEKRKKANPNAQFTWGKGVYVVILPQLLIDSNNHCAFCDLRPLRQMGATIEHFNPKSLFPLLAYFWYNLFPCCGNCQKKGELFSELLLKPDIEGFEFNDYFIYNYSTGELEANPSVSEQNQDCAEETRKLYRLNDFERPEERKQVLELYLKLQQTGAILDKNDFSFRFMLPS
jgi:uncharacterized protein (TIGR02646 family)